MQRTIDRRVELPGRREFAGLHCLQHIDDVSRRQKLARRRAAWIAELETHGRASAGHTGNREIAAFVRASIDAVTTVHHGHTPEIDVTSSTSATGNWAMEDHLWWPEGSPIARMHGYGHYHETYEKIDGRWLITSTTLTRLRTDVKTR